MTIAPCAGEPELLDPANTGAFAQAAAEMCAQAHEAPWCTYLARIDGQAVGFGGFKGPPDEKGEVEIGYLTFAPFEGQGVATRMAQALIEVARAQGQSRLIAHTLCEANASTCVLEKAGFVRDGFGNDPDEGRVWRWRLEQ